MSNSTIKPSDRVVLLGLDGATFRLIKPWVEDGTLPNFAQLFDESCHGVLNSCLPPTTPPAWSACLTGKNPGKHGIFDFRESPLKYADRPLVNLSSMQGRKLWHIFAANGRKSAVVNVPITFPPDDTIDGYMISGMMTPSNDSDWAYPADVKDEIIKAVGDYVVNIDIPKYDVELWDDANAFLADVEHSFQKRAEAMFYLLENKPWHFFMIVYVNWDRIQHLFWKYLDPEWPLYESKMAKRLRPRIIKSYQMVDEMLGKLRKKIGETPLVIMSDHGFGATRQWFNVNTWLMQNDWLKVNPEVFRKRKIFMTLMNLNDSPLVKALIPRKIQSAVRGKIRRGRSTFKSDLEAALDYSGTKAFFASIPAQGIFINVKREGAGIVEPGAEYDQLREEIRKGLYEIKDPTDGKPIVDKVFFREELYHGDQAQYAPDIVFQAKNFGCLGRQLIGLKDILQPSDKTPNGFHRIDGIFYAAGPMFKKGYEMQPAEMPDVAPTILHLTGQAIPEDMDGRVLEELFVDGFMKDHPIRKVKVDDLPEIHRKEFSKEETEELADKLRSLGYLE